MRGGELDGADRAEPVHDGLRWRVVRPGRVQGVVFPNIINSGVHVVTKANIDSPAMAGLLDPKKYQLIAVPGRLRPFLRTAPWTA